MSEVRAFDVITLAGASGDQVRVTCVATPSTYSSAEDIITILGFTEPSSWVDKLTQLEISDPGGFITGGGKVSVANQEDVELTAQGDGIPAEGNASRPIDAGFSYNVLGEIGSSGGITASLLGTSKIRSVNPCKAVAAQIGYQTTVRRWQVYGLTRAKVIVAATMRLE